MDGIRPLMRFTIRTLLLILSVLLETKYVEWKTPKDLSHSIVYFVNFLEIVFYP